MHAPGFARPQTWAAAGGDAAGACSIEAGGKVHCRANQTAPIALFGAAELVAHEQAYCARDLEGQVWCWTLSRTSSLSLIGNHVDDRAGRIEGVEGAVQVDVGRTQACARTEDGRVSCWRDVVAEVSLQTEAKDLLVRGDWACALTEDGQWCWWPGEEPYRQSAESDGRLFDGELETICVSRDSSTTCRRPRVVDPFVHSTPRPAVAVMGSKACYLDGRQLRCKERGGGQSQLIDVEASGARKIVADAERLCSLRPDGTLDCTELVVDVCQTSGVGVHRCARHDFEAKLHGVIDFDFSAGFGCAVFENGRARCWPPYRSAGDEGLFDAGSEDMRSVSVEWRNACGVDGSGHVWCWGNDGGPLGERHRPSAVATVPTRVPWLDREP